MKETNYWKEDKNKSNVNAKLPGCSAKNYYNPSINKIISNIKFEDEFFVPKYSDKSTADVHVCLENESSKYLFTNCPALIDCGFSVSVPSGYKIVFALDAKFLSTLIVCGSNYIDSNEETRFKINVLNISEKLLTLNNKDKIGKIWIEPVYLFDWNYK